METLTRLVSESLARHGFDRPVDYRRLQWSRWFRCESHHSLLIVPSKPGVFALAEEVMDLGTNSGETTRVETAASAVPQSEASGSVTATEERRFSAASGTQKIGASAPVAPEASPRRMLAVTQFFEDDDMAYVLDRMLSQSNPMRARLESGRYFIRYVEIQDQAQRRSICNALNQWIVSSAEKATGIGGHFASSLELTPEPVNAQPATMPATVSANTAHAGTAALGRPAERSSPAPAAASTLPSAIPRLDSGSAATEVYRSPLFPSGF